MLYLNKILTVDPGDHTGFAYWKGDLYPITGQINLPSKLRDSILEEQLNYMANQFVYEVKKNQPSIIYIEGVEFWEGSFKSLTSAKRQNLSKLAYLVGCYFRVVTEMKIPCRVFPARIWKGQMPNKVLEAKIYRINGQKYASEHILNAVGIGFSRMGFLQNTIKNPGRFIKNNRRIL